MSKKNKMRVFITIAVVLIIGIITSVCYMSTINKQYTQNIKQGDTAMTNGKYDDAINAYSTAVKLISDSTEANDKLSKADKLKTSAKDFALAISFFDKKDYASAIVLYKCVIKEDSKNYSVAVDKIAQCIKLGVTDVIAQAITYASQQDYDTAIKCLTNALEVDSTNQQANDLKLKYISAKSDIAKAQADAKAKADTDAKAQAQAEADAQAKAKAKTEGVRIGMTQQQVLDSNWGKPDQINKTTSAYGMHEQWVYGTSKMNFLYFDNGILTSIQN